MRTYLSYLTTIGGPWYFDRAVVFQRLINQSLYQKMLLLQKFNDIGGKVLKPTKFSLQPQKKKNEAVFHFFIFLDWDFDLDFRSFEKKSFYSHLKNVN